MSARSAGGGGAGGGGGGAGGPPRGRELGAGERVVAAGGAAVTAALVTCPLDVVKGRLQVQAGGAAGRVAGGGVAAGPGSASQSMASATSSLSRSLFTPGKRSGPRVLRAGPALAMAAPAGASVSYLGCPPRCPTIGNPGAAPLCAPQCEVYKGPLDVVRKLLRREGFRAFWRGLDASLATAIPAVGIYMPLYDTCLREASAAGLEGALCPLAAGTVARTTAVLCTAPMEMVKTRLQSMAPSKRGGGQGGGGTLLREVQLVVSSRQGGGVLNLWKGTGATLARDVPFSAVYWTMTERIKAKLLTLDGGGGWQREVGGATGTSGASGTRVVLANLAAGTTSGCVASFMTTPCDVIKTKMQVVLPGSSGSGMLDVTRNLFRAEGFSGFFAGWAPRVARTAPACGIVLTSYELLKMLPPRG